VAGAAPPVAQPEMRAVSASRHAAEWARRRCRIPIGVGRWSEGGPGHAQASVLNLSNVAIGTGNRKPPLTNAASGQLPEALHSRAIRAGMSSADIRPSHPRAYGTWVFCG